MKKYELVDYLKNKIREIKTSEKSKNEVNESKYKIRAYNNVIKVLDSYFDTNQKITKDLIVDLDLTDHMKEKLTNILETKKAPKIMKATKSKSRSRSRSKTKLAKPSNKRRVTSRSRSRSRFSDIYDSDDQKRDDQHFIQQLTELMGIGEVKAKELMSKGLESISDLKKKKWQAELSEETKTFMKLKPITRIPHNAIAEIEDKIKKLETPDMKFIFVGSYRRKADFSRDIDVMLVSNRLDAIDVAINAISKIYKTFVYSKGQDKVSFVIQLNQSEANNRDKNKCYKMDIFRVVPENYIPMLLYSTGSKGHNIYMRGRAKKKGYLLNQNGLYRVSAGDKLENERIEGLNTEEDYFKILNIPYKEPPNRN